MDVMTLEATPRGVGKGAARAVRREGQVPCVLYGRNVKPVVFQVDETELKPLIYTNETHVIRLQLDGDDWECVVKEIAFHPVTDRPMHVDFQALQRGEMITLTVPVRYHGIPVGQTDGGQTSYIVHELEVSCLPQNIPSHIDVDIAELQIGDSLHVGDLEFEGLDVLTALDRTLVTVVAPRMEPLDEEEEAEGVLLEGEEEALEGEEGEGADEAEDEEES